MLGRFKSIFFIILFIIIMSGCTTDPITSTDQEEEVIPVRVAEITSGPFIGELELSGRSRAVQEFPIITPTPVKVTEVHVKLGDHVQEGDPLLQLDDQELKEQLKAARAQVRALEQALAEANAIVRQIEQATREGLQAREEAIARAEAVLAGAQTGAVTMLDLLQASTQLMLLQGQGSSNFQGAAAGAANIQQLTFQLEQARAQLKAGEQALQEMTIRAPFDGVITLRNIQENELALPNTPLMQLSNLNQIKIDLQIPSTKVNQLEAGQPVRIRFEGEETIYSTALEAVSPSPALQTNTFQALITLDNPERAIVPGKLVTANVQSFALQDVLRVPIQAVFFQDTVPYVYVIGEQNAASLKQLELGERSREYYHVREGLEAGDIVITAGKERVTDGRKVYIQK